MKNHITWDADRTVNVHVEVKLSLEVVSISLVRTMVAIALSLQRAEVIHNAVCCRYTRFPLRTCLYQQ